MKELMFFAQSTKSYKQTTNHHIAMRVSDNVALCEIQHKTTSKPGSGDTVSNYG